MEQSRKQKLHESQGVSSTSPKLEIEKYLGVKKNESGVPCFTWYDAESKTKAFIARPFSGILLGRAMVIDHFDSKEERSYRSLPYFTNDRIVLVKNDQEKDKYFTGTLDDMTKYFGTVPKRYQALFILTEKGLIQVSTNAVLAIDQLKYAKDTFEDYEVVLTPTMYNPKDPSISKSAVKILAKLAVTNPPAYAKLSQGALITPATEERFSFDAAFEMYKAWKEYVLSLGKEKVVSEDPDLIDEDDEKAAKVQASVAAQAPVVHEDDLPF